MTTLPSVTWPSAPMAAPAEVLIARTVVARMRGTVKIAPGSANTVLPRGGWPRDENNRTAWARPLASAKDHDTHTGGPGHGPGSRIPRGISYAGGPRGLKWGRVLACGRRPGTGRLPLPTRETTMSTL